MKHRHVQTKPKLLLLLLLMPLLLMLQVLRLFLNAANAHLFYIQVSTSAYSRLQLTPPGQAHRSWTS